MSQNKRAILLLMVFIFIFGSFFYFTLSDSPVTIVVKEIRKCNNINDVKRVYQGIDDVQVKNNQTLVKEVRSKIHSLKPNEIEIDECSSWLPPRPVSINLVIVPDLSNRIYKPDQIVTDTGLINHIWATFKSLCGKKKNSKDQIALDVTDNQQANGMFKNIADRSIISLTKNDPNLFNKFYLHSEDHAFKKNVDSLYKLSTEFQTSGANYVEYFKKLNTRHFKKSTIFDEIQNKVILITDGYLELSDGTCYTQINTNPRLNPIPSIEADYGKWSILVCEVRVRDSDIGLDGFQILKTYWYDWLKKMKFQNVDGIFFLEHEAATKITKEKISTFISNSSNSNISFPNPTNQSPVSLNTNSTQNTCDDFIYRVIQELKGISASSIDDIIENAYHVCGVKSIIIDDNIIKRDFKQFLLVKANQSYSSTDIQFKSDTVTIKVQKL